MLRATHLFWVLLVGSCAGSPARAPQSSPPSKPIATETDASPATDPPAPYRLLEPRDEISAGKLPVVVDLKADDPRRAELERLLDSPYLRWVLELGRESRRWALSLCVSANPQAAEECAKRIQQPALFVIVRGGNRPKRGLVIESDGRQEELPDTWYVEIDPQRAHTLIPHEYGHVILSQMLPGDVPEHPDSLPHTTSAITNDVTAFSEGWGIHFETLAAEQPDEMLRDVRSHRHRDQFSTRFPFTHGDSLLLASDLLSYSQSYQRYGCIKDNCFAYLPRMRSELASKPSLVADDLLSRFTDSTFDPALVRSLHQMVASEGVVATLFYRLATADSSAQSSSALPDPKRYVTFLAAFATLTEDKLRTQPMVLAFLESLLELSSPDERTRIARTALEVLHYTPALADAQELYAKLHEFGHQVDQKRYFALLQTRASDMAQTVTALATTPTLIHQRPVVEIWLRHPTLEVGIPAMGLPASPLVFDLNTAPVEHLMTIPGLDLAGAQAFARERDRRGGLATIEELAQVPKLSSRTRRAIVDMHRAQPLMQRDNR